MSDILTPSHMVCTSHAYLGGKLNLAHAAAVYLPASVDAGLGFLFGRPSLFATGIDLHGRQGARTLKGLSPAEAAVRKEILVAEFPNDLAELGISVDVFIRTDAPEVAIATSEAITTLNDAGLIHKVQSVSFRCTAQCGSLSVSEVFTHDAGITNWKSHEKYAAEEGLYCTICGAEVEKTTAFQFAIDVSDDAEFLAQIPDHCFGKSGRRLLKAALNTDFKSWVISRSDYYGLSFPEVPNRQLYLWFPAIVSKAILAKNLGLSPQKFLSGRHAKFYFAKNIVQYYAHILPTIQRRWLNVESIGYSYHIRGFCEIDRSSKLLDFRAAIKKFGLAPVRFYCLYTVLDDAHDFALTPERLQAVEKGVMQGVFARFLSRFPVYEGHFPPSIGALPPKASRLWEKLDRLHDHGKIRGILLALESAIQAESLAASSEEARALAHITQVILDVYIPGWQNVGSTK